MPSRTGCNRIIYSFVFLRSSQSAGCSRPYFELPGWAGGGRLSSPAAAGLRRLTRTLQATGGEMFERIGSRAHFSETEAARCFYQVITAARLGQPHPTPCHRHERCIRGILEREVQITCYGPDYQLLHSARVICYRPGRCIRKAHQVPYNCADYNNGSPD
jgi:hypothetical protein